MTCHCSRRGYVRSLEADDFALPQNLVAVAETPSAELARCRVCRAWWERLPHYVYGHAWYRTEQRYWDAADEAAAIAAWSTRRQDVTV